MSDEMKILITGFIVVDKNSGGIILPLYPLSRHTTLEKLEQIRKTLKKIWSTRFKKDINILFVYNEE